MTGGLQQGTKSLPLEVYILVWAGTDSIEVAHMYLLGINTGEETRQGNQEGPGEGVELAVF